MCPAARQRGRQARLARHMTESEIALLLLRSVGIVTAVLTAATCLALYVRKQWPTLAVRVFTSSLFVALFPISVAAVDALITKGNWTLTSGHPAFLTIVDQSLTVSLSPAVFSLSLSRWSVVVDTRTTHPRASALYVR